MAYYHPKKNLWEASKRITLPTGEAWRARCWGRTEAEADASLSAEIARLLGQSDGTLRSFSENVYAPTVVHRSVKWREQIVWATEGYILPAFGNDPLTAITRPRVQAFFNQIVERGEPKSITSVRHIRKVFSAIMRLAWRDGIVDRNPLEAISLPDAQPTQITLWRLEEIARIVVCARGSVWQLPIFFGGIFGMRRGEALGPRLADLTPENLDLDWQVQTLRPPTGAKQGKKTGTPRLQHKNKLKTPGSHRTYFLPEGAYARIMDMRFPAEDSPFLCPNDEGGMIDPDNADRALKEAITRANRSLPAGGKQIAPGSFHDLRHSFAAILDDTGCPPPAKRELMGHTGATQSERYGGAYAERKIQVLGILISAVEDMESRLTPGRKLGRTRIFTETQIGEN